MNESIEKTVAELNSRLSPRARKRQDILAQLHDIEDVANRKTEYQYLLDEGRVQEWTLKKTLLNVVHMNHKQLKALDKAGKTVPGLVTSLTMLIRYGLVERITGKGAHGSRLKGDFRLFRLTPLAHDLIWYYEMLKRIYPEVWASW